MIAQSTLILLILVVNLFAVDKLRLVSQLNTEALTVDAACINEEKRLLKSFLAEMRNAEKFLLIRDISFREEFERNQNDFSDSMAKISSVIDTEYEKNLLAEIDSLHDNYERGDRSDQFWLKGVGSLESKSE